jgi:4-diphosphocytidyl-2-C-methyl-D-erythritol kinase
MIAPSGPEVRVSSPAKINLCLGVGPVRDDGYHPLATVYQAVGLYDEVVLRPSDTEQLTVSGEGVDVAGVPTDAENLALRAVRVLGEHHGVELTVALHIHKRIPVAGGLAGGSTDAAAALVGADALFELHTPRAALLELAAGLGSDVPFCLIGGTAMGSGRGETVTPVMTRGQYWWVIVPDDGGLSTSAVYAEFDRLTDGSTVPEPEIPDELLAALRAGSSERLGAVLANDLQDAALSLRPELAGRLRCGREVSAQGALVSGSGPTTVFLCEGPEHADQVDLLVQQECGTPPALVVAGPVHGARVTSAHRGAV